MKVPSAATVAPDIPAIRYPIKPTVMTTGPGVIMATATASTNCLSVSQWFSVTTPPYRNGTIANPEPNTNAPALVKNMPICVSRDTSRLPMMLPAIGSCVRTAALRLFLLSHLGGARNSHTRTPAAMNSHATSDSVTTVTTAKSR